VQVEDDFVFPLLKCTDLHRDRLTPGRAVIVPQRTLGQETRGLATTAPKLWSYLEANGGALDGRRSSIYRGKPRFSVFGLGPYSFAPWKVAVSGLHGDPMFRLIGPEFGKPVFFDDTCYLLPFDTPSEAALVHAILTSDGVRRFLSSVKYLGAKRPITKKLLRRIDLAAALDMTDPSEIVRRAQAELGDRTEVSEFDLSSFAESMNEPQGAFAI